MAEIDEDFQPELIVRASPQDKARARRRRSMVETEADDLPRWTFMQFWGMIGAVGCGVISAINFLFWFTMSGDAFSSILHRTEDKFMYGIVFGFFAFVSWSAFAFGGRKS